MALWSSNLFGDIKTGSSRSIPSPKLKIRLAIYTFFNEFRGKCHLNNVVFDVFVTMQQHSGVSFQVKLLELNPFFEKTDPCVSLAGTMVEILMDQ